MSEKITKYLIVSVLFIWCQANPATAQEPNKVDFDPFAAEANSSTMNNKSTSGPVIPQVEFNNNDISMAFQIISDATGWSIFPTAEVSKAKINLWAKNISAQQLLDTVITMAGFVYYREGDVITVMTYDEYMQYHGLEKKVFDLKFATAASVDAVVKPFLTKLGKSVIHKETNTIVIYEATANLEFIKAVIEKIDNPSENIIIEVINLKYADCESLSKTLQSVFSGQKKETRNNSALTDINSSEVNGPVINLSVDSIEIYAVTNANQLVIVGVKTDVEKVKNLVSMVDVYGNNMILEVIDLKYADSELIAEKLKQLFSEDKAKTQEVKNKEPVVESSGPAPVPENMLSPQSPVYIQSLGRTNQLIIKAYRADTERIKQLISKLDSYVEPITKNYQLIYIDASEIFSGLERILNLDITNSRSTENRDKSQGLTLISKTNSILLAGPPSAHRIMTSIVESIDNPSTYETGMIRIYKLENADVEEAAKTISELLAADSTKKESSSKVSFSQKNAPESQASSVGSFAQSEEFVPQIEARVSVNKSTNSIVVQATARQHRELEKLIKELDKRRKQVLIEAIIVELENTDNLNLGVELAVPGIFSSFGLSGNIDSIAGTSDIVVNSGGSAIISYDRFKAIVHALKQDGSARITSAPQILVNDNAVGYINSIQEEPTTQTNQGDTTTTTSFTGYVDAGTKFAITPHISEKDYLRVEYQITLSSFGAKSTDTSIPPARSTSTIQSEATVPNGNTIIVGGLQASNENENIDKIPVLGDVPVIGLAFKNTQKAKQHRKTYLFITPRIMENENFSDLKQASNIALKQADVNGVPDEVQSDEEIESDE